MKKITIITGVLNEEATVRDVHAVIRGVLEPLAPKYDYEHIFLDNCSTDSTLDILREIAAKDPRVKVLSYSRNFGPVKSGMVGLRAASGDAVIGYEANLKDPPEMIPLFIKHWEEGYPVVYGQRPKTGDPFWMLALRKIYYRMAKALAEEPLHNDFGGFALLDRKVIDEIRGLDDYKPYVRGYISAIGFKQKGIQYERRARPTGKGKSKSTMTYLVDFAINGLISYSIVPIRVCTYIGMTLAGLSFLLAIAYLIVKLVLWNFQAPGIATVVILIFFFSGIQLFFLGVIGEYVGAIHSQVRKKPFVVIREKINYDGPDDLT